MNNDLAADQGKRPMLRRVLARQGLCKSAQIQKRGEIARPVLLNIEAHERTVTDGKMLDRGLFVLGEIFPPLGNPLPPVKVGPVIQVHELDISAVQVVEAAHKPAVNMPGVQDEFATGITPVKGAELFLYGPDIKVCFVALNAVQRRSPQRNVGQYHVVRVTGERPAVERSNSGSGQPMMQACRAALVETDKKNGARNGQANRHQSNPD